MKTIFAKYNRERLPCFQIVTKIVEDNGTKKAIKLPLVDQASSHINTIYNNYELLLKKYPHINLCKPNLKDNGIEFEFISGQSFENLLKQALDSQDKELFLELIKKYVDYVDTFVIHKQIKFVPCNKFIEIFGNWNIDEPQDIISVANIDLIFSNLLVSESSITQIDYEWVFDFAIPKSLMIWRSLYVFFASYGVVYTNLLNIDEALAYIGINPQNYDKYSLLDVSFRKTVYGNEYKFLLNERVVKPMVNILRDIEFIIKNLDEREKNISYRENNLSNIENTLVYRIINKIMKVYKAWLKKC